MVWQFRGRVHLATRWRSSPHGLTSSQLLKGVWNVWLKLSNPQRKMVFSENETTEQASFLQKSAVKEFLILLKYIWYQSYGQKSDSRRQTWKNLPCFSHRLLFPNSLQIVNVFLISKIANTYWRKLRQLWKRKYKSHIVQSLRDSYC